MSAAEHVSLTRAGARTPYRARKLAEIVAHEIVAEITGRGLEPGDVLPPEAEMVKAYGVGRATLREALRLLEVQGLISLRPGPGGGPIVTRIGAPDFARITTLFLKVAGATKGEIVAARVELESSMARLAAESQDEDGLAQLRAELEHAASVSLDDDEAFQHLSRSFHMTVAGISGNRTLDLFSRSLKVIYDLCVPAALLPLTDRENVRKIHAEIGEAILAGRGEQAESLMRAHLEQARANTAAQFPGLMAETIEWA